MKDERFRRTEGVKCKITWDKSICKEEKCEEWDDQCVDGEDDRWTKEGRKLEMRNLEGWEKSIGEGEKCKKWGQKASKIFFFPPCMLFTYGKLDKYADKFSGVVNVCEKESLL